MLENNFFLVYLHSYFKFARTKLFYLFILQTQEIASCFLKQFLRFWYEIQARKKMKFSQSLLYFQHEERRKKTCEGKYNKIEPFVCVGSGFSKIHIFICIPTACVYIWRGWNLLHKKDFSEFSFSCHMNHV